MKKSSPLIKICGIKSLEELNCVSDNGAEWYGIMFVKSSPRYISLQQACKLINKTPQGLNPVAVVVNPTISNIENLIQIGFKNIQLHGNETREFCKFIRIKYKVNLIKSININSQKDLLQAETYKNHVDWLLFDYKDEKEMGGTGKSFDWKILSDINLKFDWILSGGLDYTNVVNAIKVTGAKAVDVSSGVEIERGKKSIELINKFCNSTKNI